MFNSTRMGRVSSAAPHVPPAPHPAGGEQGRRLKPRRVPPDRWVLDRMGRVSSATFAPGSSPSRERAGETALAAAGSTRLVDTRPVAGVALAPPVPRTASGVLKHSPRTIRNRGEGGRPAGVPPAAMEAAGRERRIAPRWEALRPQTAQPLLLSPRRCARRAVMENTTQAPCVVGPGVWASTIE
jgi:hypothetical protein